MPSMEREPSFGWFSLPDELLREVIARAGQSGKRSMQLTCRHWCQQVRLATPAIHVAIAEPLKASDLLALQSYQALSLVRVTASAQLISSI
ncbi:hypothetical protein WJX72_010784 [[Myrmecia] bisecta]|uniref:F-box domain-containing protein n=1 Tax=[Myrmecia] bisecta TaxID=41462 RepID=A0AAW1QGA2_9CHLO